MRRIELTGTLRREAIDPCTSSRPGARELNDPKNGSIAEFVGREVGGRRRSMEKFQERNFPTELANAVGIRTSPTAPATGYEFKMESLRDKEE
jgi:hypothetical protein